MSILHEKNLLFLFYTSTFTKHPHQSIFTDPQSITINDHSTPNHHHHHPATIITTQLASSRKTNPLNPKPIHHPPNPKPSQAKSSPTQTTTRSSKPTKELEKTSRLRSKPTNPHPQSTKKPATNKSERDRRLRPEQDRRLAAPPPPRDGHRHALHPA